MGQRWLPVTNYKSFLYEIPSVQQSLLYIDLNYVIIQNTCMLHKTNLFTQFVYLWCNGFLHWWFHKPTVIKWNMSTNKWGSCSTESNFSKIVCLYMLIFHSGLFMKYKHSSHKHFHGQGELSRTVNKDKWELDISIPCITYPYAQTLDSRNYSWYIEVNYEIWLSSIMSFMVYNIQWKHAPKGLLVSLSRIWLKVVLASNRAIAIGIDS